MLVGHHIGEQAQKLLPNHFVAFTDSGLEPRPIEDSDASPAVGNQPSGLQSPRGLGHALASHSEHVRYQLLGHAQLVCRETVETEKQPAAQLLVNGVVTIADRRLGMVSPPMNRATPTMPSLPATANSADAPSSIV